MEDITTGILGTGRGTQEVTGRKYQENIALQVKLLDGNNKDTSTLDLIVWKFGNHQRGCNLVTTKGDVTT